MNRKIWSAVFFLAYTSILCLSCGPSTSPFTSANSSVNITMFNSANARGTSAISDTADNTVRVGVCPYLYNFIDSVLVSISHGQSDTDTAIGFGRFASATDTFWINIAFRTAGPRTVTATALKSGAAVHVSATITVFARPRSISYDGNGSTGGILPHDAGTYIEGANVTVMANTGSLVKTGFTFSGWDTTTNGTAQTFQGGETFVMPDKNVTFYAKWTPIPAPSAPTISSVLSGDAKVTVTWAALSGAASYNLYCDTGTAVDKSGTEVLSVTSPFDVTNLTNGLTYTFALTAVNAGGESPLSAEKTATPQIPVPAAPVIGSVTADNTKATVTWGPVTGASSYNLYYATGSTVDKSGTKISGAASPMDVSGLSTGITYAFAVSAVNAGGESPISNMITAMLKTYAFVCAGDGCSFAVMSNGTLWATGSNSAGQLGDSTTTDRKSFYQVASGVSSVAARETFTLILKKDGSLWGTGSNFVGELANNSTVNQHAPVLAMNGVSAVSAGQEHTLILKSDGTVWAVGENVLGQLGLGDTINRTSPQQVPIYGVAAISAGSQHSMILKKDGSLWGAGANQAGQLGDGTDSNRTLAVHIMDGVAAVSAGQYHTMILKIDGTLWAAGNNGYGQLGDTAVMTGIPAQIMSNVAQVSAGGDHTMILKLDGSLWGTGTNFRGELGDGTNIDRPLPVKVMTNVACVSAGNRHTLIIKNDGTLYTVGENWAGALGDGTTTDRSTPVYIP